MGKLVADELTSAFDFPLFFLLYLLFITDFELQVAPRDDVDHATATDPVLTALLVSDSLEADPFAVCVCVCVFDDLLEQEDSLHLFSSASSISICSCLHSWLQNGVFPLQIH